MEALIGRSRRTAAAMRCLPALLLVLLGLVLNASTGAAQPLDSRGREFWVAFPRNFGSEGESGQSDMRLYVASDSVANVVFTNTLTGAQVSLRISLPNRPVELDLTGSPAFGPDFELDLNELIGRRSVHITSDRDITLYGCSVRQMSADAFLGLPVDVLTGRYIVAAYPNGYSGGQGFDEFDMPSQFCVIGTADSTVVRIDPSAPLRGYGSGTFTVTLNAGDVFYGMALLYDDFDVSGTEIRATKPVTVLAGNRRTSIPEMIGNYRDYLIEQMPPLEAWGQEAIISPLYPITPMSPEVGVVRVFAAFDNTRWWVNGVEQLALASRVPIELPVRGPMHITASAPILVAQYEHSVNLETSGGQFALGDPFMLIVPPPEQFDSSYAFQSIPHEEFPRHFINVVAPMTADRTLVLDGTRIASTLTPISGTTFGYLQLEVSPGGHYIRADRPFGLVAYGYGHANSYGYIGGMLFRTLVRDFEAPDIEQSVLCGEVNGIAFDSKITDTGIDSCYATSQTSNATVTIDPFVPGADTVHFRARLIDPYKDGVAAIMAVDSSGKTRQQVIPIPGYTLSVVNAPPGTVGQIDTVVLYNDVLECRSVQIVNTGRYPHDVRALTITPPMALPDAEASFQTPLPVTVQPGATATIEICVRLHVDTTFSVTIGMGDECRTLPMALVPMTRSTDTTAPGLSGQFRGCGPDALLRFIDSSGTSSGIIRVTYDSLINCRVNSQSPSELSGPVRNVETSLSLIDGRRDGFVQATVQDYVGNRSTVRDTIPGFTFAMLNRDRDSVAIRFDRAWQTDTVPPGQGRCDSITMINYGVRDVTIGSILMRRNISLSVPPSQFPIVIPPGGERRLAICLDGRTGISSLDTMIVTDACDRMEAVAVVLDATPLGGTGADICRSTIVVRSSMAARRNFITAPVPNPATGASAYVDIGLTNGGAVDLDLVSSDGTHTTPLMRAAYLAAGLHRVTFAIDNVGSGSYFCTMKTAEGATYTSRIVVAH